MKVSELQGAALNWAVRQADGFTCGNLFKPSTDWAQGGPIIEREGIGFKLSGTLAFCAWKSYGIGKHQNEHSQYGPTPLVAAMRCYVASKLGDEIELPEELK